MQLKLHMVTIEDLVPEGHFLRRLEQALDLSFVYEETVYLYSRKYGRPPIDPVVLVKYLLVGYLYGIPSERQIEQRIQTDVALRWYLGLDLFDRVPDHSTISQLRRRKPSFRKVFRRLFEEVVRQCVTKGLVSGRLAATDSTHVKANEAITLKLTFKGSGNLKYLKNPELDLPNDFETYDPKVDLSVKATAGGVSGTRTVEYTTIPRFAGTFKIPAVEVSYFDTKAKQYKTLRTEEYEITVDKGAPGSGGKTVSNFTNKEDLKLLNKDIHYIS